MSTISAVPQQTMVTMNGVSLPKYNVNGFENLPSNAAAEGVFADGDVYYIGSKMLTSSDIAMLHAMTGQTSFQDNPLAIAIETDRADVAIGWAGGLTGNVTAGYLQSIEASESNPTGNGTYDGVKVSSEELNAAVEYLNSSNADSSSSPTSVVSVSA